jgi:hypothetical protein
MPGQYPFTVFRLNEHTASWSIARRLYIDHHGQARLIERANGIGDKGNLGKRLG